MAYQAGAVVATLKANTEQFKSQLAGATKHLKAQSKAISGSAKTMANNIKNSVQAGIGKAVSIAKTGALAIGGSVVAIGGLALKTAGDFEKLRISLKTAFGGNVKAAKEAEKQIKSFTARTPFQLQEVTDSFIKLRNMGLNPSEKAMTSYGDTASAMGKSLNQMVEAVADAATGEFERLKEFGIRASSEGDRVKFTFKGVTTEVGKNSKEIEDYLIKLGEANFAGGMAEQSRSLFGLFSTLKDTVLNTLDTIAVESGLLDSAKMGIESLGATILANQDKIATFAKTVGAFISGVLSFGRQAFNLFQEYWPKIQEALAPVVAILRDQFNKAFEDFRVYALPPLKELWISFKENILPILIQVGIAIGAIVIAFIRALPFVIAFWAKTQAFFFELTGTIFRFASGFIKGVIGAFKTVWNFARGFWKGLTGGFTSVFGGIANYVTGVFRKIGNHIKWVLNIANKVIKKIKNIKLPDIKLPKFADGGIVPGRSFTGDKVLARVNSGEMVLNSKQQAKLFSMLQPNNVDNRRNITINQYGNNMNANFIPQYGF